MNLYGVIGDDVLAKDVKARLAAMDQTQPLLVRIDSEGGSVFQGFSIANALEEYPGPKKIIVEPMAFSIASYIVSIFDEVEIVENGYLMAHLPYSEQGGTADELESSARLLSDLQGKMIERYSAKTKLSSEQVMEILKAETFVNAEEAVAMGLATRVLPSNVKTRVSAKNKTMPLRVVASLRGEAPGGDNNSESRDKTMSNTPVAATVSEIKAAFPKAKAEFIVRCLEKSLPLASVAAAAAEELMAENEMLTAKVKSYEEELMALKAEMTEEEPKGEVVVVEEEDDEEEMPSAKAKAKAKTGASAVPKAKYRGNGQSARAKWTTVLAEEIQAHKGNRKQAFNAVLAKYPGLREAMLEEVNADR
jgi:ATP-dependent protease ClpP protease subunit